MSLCKISKRYKYFCKSCWGKFQILDPSKRCKGCFLESERRICNVCQKKSNLLLSMAFVFDKEIAFKLIKVSSVESITGFLVYQFLNLKWDLPDVVLAFDGAEKVAKCFSEMLDLKFSKIDWGIDEGWKILLIDIDTCEELLQNQFLKIIERFPKELKCLGFVSRNQDFQ